MAFLPAANVATEMYHSEQWSTPKFFDLAATNASSPLSKYLIFAGREGVDTGLVINTDNLIARNELEFKNIHVAMEFSISVQKRICLKPSRAVGQKRQTRPSPGHRKMLAGNKVQGSWSPSPMHPAKKSHIKERIQTAAKHWSQ